LGFLDLKGGLSPAGRIFSTRPPFCVFLHIPVIFSPPCLIRPYFLHLYKFAVSSYSPAHHQTVRSGVSGLPDAEIRFSRPILKERRKAP